MPKFRKGDYVVHPGQGVCEVGGIVERPSAAGQEGTANQACLIYELYPASGPRMRICFPVANEAQLRPPVGRREAQALIAEMPRLVDDSFSDPHAWTVEEHYLGGLRQGTCEDALRIAKTMHDLMERAHANGKKPKVCYERIYKTARDRALLELGIALDKTPDEVDTLIERSFAEADRRLRA